MVFAVVLEKESSSGSKVLNMRILALGISVTLALAWTWRSPKLISQLLTIESWLVKALAFPFRIFSALLPLICYMILANIL